MIVILIHIIFLFFEDFRRIIIWILEVFLVEAEGVEGGEGGGGGAEGEEWWEWGGWGGGRGDRKGGVRGSECGSSWGAVIWKAHLYQIGSTEKN